MLEEVNSQLPPDSRTKIFSRRVVHAQDGAASQRIRRLRPGGHLLARKRTAQAAGLVCLLSCGWALGLFEHGGSSADI